MHTSLNIKPTRTLYRKHFITQNPILNSGAFDNCTCVCNKNISIVLNLSYL